MVGVQEVKLTLLALIALRTKIMEEPSISKSQWRLWVW